MASTKAATTIVANPSAIHHSSPPSFAAPHLLSTIPKAIFVSAATRSVQRSLSVSAVTYPSATSPTPTPATTAPSPLRRFLSNEPRNGADILIEALEREGITEVVAYPSDTSMEIHHALTHSPSITNNLLRHEQGEVFAASGYARSTGHPGICIATSGPGTTNPVSSLASTLLDSIPMVAITGQVPCQMIGTDTFQETPIVEVTCSITKYNYLVLDVDDIPHIIKETFFLVSSDHSSPALVNIPKDIQQQLSIRIWDPPLRLPGYLSHLPKSPARPLLDQIVRHVSESRCPILYVDGGCSSFGDELRRFIELTGIPVTTTLMGLGNYPNTIKLSPRMLGMYGTILSSFRSSFSLLLCRLFHTAFNYINITPTSLQQRD